MRRGHFRLMKRAFSTITLSAILIAALVAPCAAFAAPGGKRQAAEQKNNQIQDIIKEAERYYLQGQQAYAEGEYDRARRDFDKAVDTVLIASIDVRSDDNLRVYYRELIEKINRYQILAMEQKDGGFNEQRYEPSPLDKIASLSEPDLEEVAAETETPTNVR